ncbi:MAG: hypothetical protein HYS13_13865 [Planctomycetia bacterium]|nr:hypothetical protein [Planctomycetia bacterium]
MRHAAGGIDAGRLCDACAAKPEATAPALNPYQPPQTEESPPPRQLRLAVVRVLVWIACVGGVLAVHRLLLRSPGAVSAFSDAYAALGSVVQGTALAGVVLAAARWRRKERFPAHPGEWLWLATGMIAATRLVTDGLRDVISRVAFGGRDLSLVPSTRSLDIALVISTYVCDVLVFAAAAFAVRQRAWRWWMIGKAIAAPLAARFVFVQMAWRISPDEISLATILALGTTGFVLAPALLLVLVLVDISQRRWYSWTHWAGIVIYLCNVAGVTFRFVVSVLAFSGWI